MKKALLYLSFVCLVAIYSLPAWATVGVGVGTGKVKIEEKLKAGMNYHLPPLNVINTGDEAGEYQAVISYNQAEEPMHPAQNWFTFKPEKFYLEPGQVQPVEIELNLPLQLTPGDYFAYLEGRPVQGGQNGQTKVGVAAAAKLYFTIAPANIFEALYYQTHAWWENHLPWSNLFGGLLLASVLFYFLRRRFSLNIRLEKKPANKDE